MYLHQDIRTVHLEITAKCPSGLFAVRFNINGGDSIPNIKLDESLEDCKKYSTSNL